MTKHTDREGLNRRGLAAVAGLLPLAGLIALAPGNALAQSSAESTFDRVRRTKVLRIAALPGELPYFQKDLTTGAWSGACISMALDIAKVFESKLEYIESTYGNSVLDLQSNKVDIAFALNPTPARALSITFTEPMIIHPFGCLAKHGLAPKTWDDLNKPALTVVFDLGSLHETVARRYCPKANLVGFKTRDECTLALQSGRADAHIQAALLGLSTVGKNPSLGPYYLLTDPTVALPSCIGLQREPDTRFKEVINAWLAMNRGTGQIREWMLDGLAKFGVTRDQVPSTLTF
ncbi:MAG TPA: transporter substrate-binding domain-containing protein [Rhodopila sp.]|jgi:polar amino acid transport system substrate-binding protein|nr:transporter substrate-binding domain-containing protein [Rhodopila sp.]